MKILSVFCLSFCLVIISHTTGGAAYRLSPYSSGPGAIELTIELDENIKMDSLYAYFISPIKGETVIDSILAFEIPERRIFKYHGFTKGGGQLVIKAKPAVQGKFKHRYLPITPVFYWQAQDRVYIRITKRTSRELTGNSLDDYVFAFSGAGSEKYWVREKILRARLNAEPAPDSAINQHMPYQDLLAPKVDAALKALEELKPMLSDHFYQLFKADIVGWQAGRFTRLSRMCEGQPGMDSSACLLFLRQNLHTVFDSAAKISPAIAGLSFQYVNYLYEKLLFESSLNKAAGTQADYVSIITKQHQGALRDRLLLSLFLNHAPSEDINFLYRQVRPLILDSVWLATLDESIKALPGMPVKDFQLSDLDGKAVQLADLKGKIAFVDVWFSGCGACAAYYRDVLKEAEELLRGERDIVFVSISTDGSQQLWKRSISSGKYSSPAVVNLFTGGREHPWVKYYNFESVPKIMIINRSGQIEGIYNNGLADGINTTAALVSTLKKTQQAQ